MLMFRTYYSGMIYYQGDRLALQAVDEWAIPLNRGPALPMPTDQNTILHQQRRWLLPEFA